MQKFIVLSNKKSQILVCFCRFTLLCPSVILKTGNNWSCDSWIFVLSKTLLMFFTLTVFFLFLFKKHCIQSKVSDFSHSFSTSIISPDSHYWAGNEFHTIESSCKIKLTCPIKRSTILILPQLLITLIKATFSQYVR